MVQTVVPFFVLLKDVDFCVYKHFNDLAAIVEDGHVQRRVAHFVTHIYINLTSVNEEVRHVEKVILDCIVQWSLPHLIHIFKERPYVLNLEQRN